MEYIQRFFLIVEGQKDGYPNYESAKIHFEERDPSEIAFKNLFICSPLFSVSPQGYTKIPDLTDGTRITFIMVPNVFPTWDKLFRKFQLKDELWFSLGLANLVVIENKYSPGITDKILQFLRGNENITASETWHIKDKKICPKTKVDRVFEHNEKSAEYFQVGLSPKLPLHLCFGVSEYIISINKFLTASKKFTPHYYQKHTRTIDMSRDLVYDLSFLYGDESYKPSIALLNSLNVKTVEDAGRFLVTQKGKKCREDLINDRNARLIQFNSSMSYVYSQAYSGTFPIFDHIGIIRRHSLLGVGTAIGALFELVSQIEESMYFLPFEKKENLIYKATIPTVGYLDFLTEPSNYNADLWKNDAERKAQEHYVDPSLNKMNIPDDFFNRLSFFSGRLGFREYDLSATAAIQVLVEGNSLQWHVINYTHEIIHNHVRMILNNLITPPTSLRNSTDNEFVKFYSELLKKAYRDKDSVSLN